MSKRSISVFLILIVLAAAMSFWLLFAPLVAALTVQRTALVQSFQFSGRVASPSRVDLGATITGRVSQVLVAEGASVRRGEPLLRLEDAELQSALTQAVAGEQQAVARLDGLRNSGRRSAQALVAQAQSVLTAAQADMQRSVDLLARGFVSAARVDESRRNLLVAQAQLAAAQAQNAASAEQGSDTAQTQAQLSQALATVQAARARLSQSQLLAPADGLVLWRGVEPGQIVQPGKALFAMALAGPVQLVAAVDERYLQQLQPGQPASVRADAFADQRFDAQVLSIAPLVDAQKGSVEVKFSVARPPAYLRQDMTLSVEVQTARRDAALVVPVSALRGSDKAAGGMGGTLWLAQEGRVQARNVRLGLRTLEVVEIVQGLEAGDLVLLGVSPAPGQRVRADTSAPPPPPLGRARSEDAGSVMSNAMGR